MMSYVVWCLLLILTACLVFSGAPSLIVAVSAWTGGLLTMEIFRNRKV